MKAKFNQETRDFIEGVFSHNPDKYGTPETQLVYLETMERQKYNYYCDCTNRSFFGKWTQEQVGEYESAWNEVIKMIEERKALL